MRVAIVWRAAVWSFTEEENTDKSSANLLKLVVVRTDSQSASTSGKYHLPLPWTAAGEIPTSMCS